MTSNHLLLMAGLALVLAGCGQADETGTQVPATNESAATAGGSGLALARAEVGSVEALVASDSENCQMPEGAERDSEVVDLGGGVGAVIMECSRGMRDQWRRLYVIQEGGGHHMAVPLIQYDIQGDGEWRAEFAQPNLEWDAESRTFVSTIRGANACGSTTTWRWDDAQQRVAMVSTSVQDCEGVTEEASLPEPRTIRPTTPPTSEPTPTA